MSGRWSAVGDLALLDLGLEVDVLPEGIVLLGGVDEDLLRLQLADVLRFPSVETLRYQVAKRRLHIGRFV